MNRFNIFKKLFFAALLASLANSNVLGMDTVCEPQRKKRRIEKTIATQTPLTMEIEQTPEDAVEQLTDETTSRKRTNDKISQPDDDQPSVTQEKIEEVERPTQRVRIASPFSAMHTQLDQALSRYAPGYKWVRSKCYNYFWPQDFSSAPDIVLSNATALSDIPDVVLLNEIFPLLIEHTNTVDGICANVQKLVKLSLVCKRFKALLTKEYILSILKNAGIDPEILKRPDKNGYTPLHTAAQENNTVKIWVLIKFFNINPNPVIDYPLPLEQGWTPLHLAARKNNTNAIKTLVAAGADPDAIIYNPQALYYGWTPLHIAARRKKTTDALKTLVAVGANPNVIIDIGNKPIRPLFYRWTPLHFAAYKNNTDAIKTLVSAGADPNYINPKYMYDELTDKSYDDPLLVALRYNNTAAILELLDKGANPNTAIYRFDIEIYRLDYKDTNSSYKSRIAPSICESALHLAIQFANITAIQALLDKGADPNIKNWDGRTPSQLCGANKQIQLLLDPSAKSSPWMY